MLYVPWLASHNGQQGQIHVEWLYKIVIVHDCTISRFVTPCCIVTVGAWTAHPSPRGHNRVSQSDDDDSGWRRRQLPGASGAGRAGGAADSDLSHHNLVSEPCRHDRRQRSGWPGRGERGRGIHGEPGRKWRQEGLKQPGALPNERRIVQQTHQCWTLPRPIQVSIVHTTEHRSTFPAR